MLETVVLYTGSIIIYSLLFLFWLFTHTFIHESGHNFVILKRSNEHTIVIIGESKAVLNGNYFFTFKTKRTVFYFTFPKITFKGTMKLGKTFTQSNYQRIKDDDTRLMSVAGYIAQILYGLVLFIIVSIFVILNNGSLLGLIIFFTLFILLNITQWLSSSDRFSYKNPTQAKLNHSEILHKEIEEDYYSYTSTKNLYLL